MLKRVEEEISWLMWAVALLLSQVAPTEVKSGKTRFDFVWLRFF